MPNKALGLIICLVLAALASYGIGYWIDGQMSQIEENSSLSTYDGSLLGSAQRWAYFITLEPKAPDANLLQDLVYKYDRYLYQGGGDNWLAWRETYDNNYAAIIAESATPSADWRAQLLRLQDRATPTKWIALIGFIISVLALWSGRLKETSLFTPVFYALVVGLTLWTYGSMSAPFWCLAAGLSYVAYAVGLWFLPVYRTQWVRSLRPLLTIFLVVLAAIAWRGPDGLDRLLLEEGVGRFLVLSIASFGLFLHWDHLARAMRQAKVSVSGQVMGYIAALGSSWLILGLIVGFWQMDKYNGLSMLNLELQIAPEAWGLLADPDWAFGLFFVGFGMVIIGSIGYFIQRIAR